jgi:OmpA-OmpF porin, OOP family
MKNYLLTLIGFLALNSILWGQTPPPGGTYPLKDSVNVRERHKMRQWSYENNLSAFPAPRKSNWTLGLQHGYSFITGDIRSERGLGFGLNVRAPLGHVMSIRAQGSYCTAKGLNWKPNQGYLKNGALNGITNPDANYTTPGTYNHVYYNYKMNMFDFNVQGVINLNNIHFYNKEPKVGAFVFVGVGAMLYKTSVDALDANGQIYDYSTVPLPSGVSDRSATLDQLHNILDGEYETAADNYYANRSLFNRVVAPTASIGGGLSFKLSRRLDLTVEHRTLWTTDDLLDGHQWEETLTLTSNADLHQFTSIGINIQIGKGEPSAWWSNPLRRPYDEIRSLKMANQKASKDSDGDGVFDAQDKEAATPKGARVDVMGVAVDSDEDSFQDFRDKQPYSPKGAKVDGQGVALDTDADGVPDVFDQEAASAAGAQVDAKGITIKGVTAGTQTGDFDMSKRDADFLLPMINFDLGKSDIKQEFYPSLYYVARLMLRHPSVKMRVVGHTDVRGELTANAELSKKRAQNTVDFLVGNFGIAKDRFIYEGMSSTSPLIKDLPKNHDASKEGFHYLNRRVEFQLITD